MKKLMIAIVALALCQVFVPQTDAQVSYTPGKKVAFVSTAPGGAPLPGPAPAALLTATILKGKKKTVLTADATLTRGLLAPFAPWDLSIGVDVNSIPLTPGTTWPFSIVQDCGSEFPGGPYTGIAEGCTVSGHFMIDIDAAEVASPGCCYNIPLVVTLTAGPGTNPFIAGIPVEATMAVRMEKKK